MGRRFGRALAVITAGGALLAAAQAWAADATVVATDGPPAFTDASRNPVIPQGGTLDLTNDGTQTHDLTHDNGPALDLFGSGNVAPGQTAPVNGVSSLPAGGYAFYCSIHPAMTGTLTVTGSSPPPPPPPDIDVSIPRQTLAQVLARNKIFVRLQAKTPSPDISLVARKGARVLGRKSNIDMPQPATRIVRIALTRAGRRLLKGLETARVTVRGTVPDGLPDSATRVLR